MTDNEQPRITLKGGADFAAPWVTVPFDNPGEAVEKLDAINNSNLLEKVVETSNLFRAAYAAGPLVAGNALPAGSSFGGGDQANAPSAPPTKQQGWGQQNGGGQQAGPRLHPTDSCQQCGARVQERDVFRKSDNKKFEFWACPNQRQKGDGHYSEFRN